MANIPGQLLKTALFRKPTSSNTAATDTVADMKEYIRDIEISQETSLLNISTMDTRATKYVAGHTDWTVTINLNPDAADNKSVAMFLEDTDTWRGMAIEWMDPDTSAKDLQFQAGLIFQTSNLTGNQDLDANNQVVFKPAAKGTPAFARSTTAIAESDTGTVVPPRGV